MTVSGMVTKRHIGTEEHLTLSGTFAQRELNLAPYQKASQIRRDMASKDAGAISDDGAGAYDRLMKFLADRSVGVKMTVTGTLQKTGRNKFSLDVRDFKV